MSAMVCKSSGTVRASNDDGDGHDDDDDDGGDETTQLPKLTLYS